WRSGRGDRAQGVTHRCHAAGIPVDAPICIAQVFEYEHGLVRVVVEGDQLGREVRGQLGVNLGFAAERPGEVRRCGGLDENATAIGQLDGEPIVAASDCVRWLPWRGASLPAS